MRTVADGFGDWDRTALPLVLTAIAERYQNRAWLFVSEAMLSSIRKRRTISDGGAISSVQQTPARELAGPTLFLFKVSGQFEPWTGAPFWFPTLTFPSSMPMQVYNMTE